MEKKIRKAVRCYCFDGDKVLAIKYKEGNKKAGYFDIPGGKIEGNENSVEAAIRETKEETSVIVSDLKFRGKVRVEYPKRIIDFDVFYTNTYVGDPKESMENTSSFEEINMLLDNDKILSHMMLIDRFHIDALTNDNTEFYMYLNIDEDEKILENNFSYII